MTTSEKNISILVPATEKVKRGPLKKAIDCPTHLPVAEEPPKSVVVPPSEIIVPETPPKKEKKEKIPKVPKPKKLRKKDIVLTEEQIEAKKERAKMLQKERKHRFFVKHRERVLQDCKYKYRATKFIAALLEHGLADSAEHAAEIAEKAGAENRCSGCLQRIPKDFNFLLE